MRRNSVFAARHEAPPPADVPMYWTINRIVNVTVVLGMCNRLL